MMNMGLCKYWFNLCYFYSSELLYIKAKDAYLKKELFNKNNSIDISEKLILKTADTFKLFTVQTIAIFQLYNPLKKGVRKISLIFQIKISRVIFLRLTRLPLIFFSSHVHVT